MGKTRLLLISIAVIVVTFFSQGTLAYYSTVGRATNVVTSGDIQLIIHEKTDAGTDFPAEGVYIIPGDIVSKRVSIENVCSHPFYLRVKIINGVNDEALSSDDCFKLNIDENNWMLVDGYYYYKKIVQPGETTPEVFTKVEIVGSKVDNSYIGKTLELTVAAHAVQSENNPADAPWLASGWPEA